MERRSETIAPVTVGNQLTTIDQIAIRLSVNVLILPRLIGETLNINV